MMGSDLVHALNSNILTRCTQCLPTDGPKIHKTEFLNIMVRRVGLLPECATITIRHLDRHGLFNPSALDILIPKRNMIKMCPLKKLWIKQILGCPECDLIGIAVVPFTSESEQGFRHKVAAHINVPKPFCLPEECRRGGVRATLGLAAVLCAWVRNAGSSTKRQYLLRLNPTRGY